MDSRNGGEQIRAPWGQETADRLNFYQADPRWHPFTCANRPHPDNPEARLVATADGWVCPYPDCDYTQGWAHAHMALPLWIVEMSLEIPQGRDAQQYAADVQRFIRPGSVLPHMTPDRQASVTVYTTVQARTAGDAQRQVGDAIRTGLSGDQADVFEVSVRRSTR